MTIYGEYLFLENAISGAVILLLTEKMCGYKLQVGWIIIGSILCGTYAFSIFLPMKEFLSLLSKLAFSVGLVLLVFRPDTKLRLCKTALMFYAISFFMGGTTVAMMYLTKMPGVLANGSVYVHQITYLQVIVGIFVTSIFGIWITKYFKERRHRSAVMTEIEIWVDDCSWRVKAFVDTGNFLKDPITGYPAILLSANIGTKVKDTLQSRILQRYCVIPYCSVGKQGMLDGIRPDYVVMEGQIIKRVVLAISEESFHPWRGTENYDALLQQQIFEGRSLNYA